MEMEVKQAQLEGDLKAHERECAMRYQGIEKALQRARSAYSGLSTLCMPRSSLSSSAQARLQLFSRNSSDSEMTPGDFICRLPVQKKSLLRSGAS